ncbi:MAG: hypothetical protein SPL21_00495 [Fibrobacter sp.]|nr:hypothetical protein [Fibrobacter sp.]
MQRKLDKDFAIDVSLIRYSDETLLNEVDGMTDMLYEKQGSYLQGKEDDAKAMLIRNYPIEDIIAITSLSKDKIIKLQAELVKSAK